MAMMHKYVLTVFYGPVKMAELCSKSDSCPFGMHADVPVVCPFVKDCDDITPEDWEKLEVKDENV